MTLDHSPDESLSSRSSTSVVSVMTSSGSDKRPQDLGISVTSNISSSGGEMIQLDGMEAFWRRILSATRDFHDIAAMVN